MCGIIGAIKPFKNLEIDCLHHRGPDSNGLWDDNHILLGHTRLKIIDLSKNGSQPMISKSQKYILVYNGEIYNFQEIRKQLINLGYEFQSNSDSEVLLNAYQEWGIKSLNKLNGMFAFAIWNKEKKELILARDRYGVKPLVYYWDGKTFIFSSEIKGILAQKNNNHLNTELNYQALKSFFTFSYISAPNTVYKNIFKLNPGSILVVKKNDQEISVLEKKWYNFNRIKDNNNLGYEDSKIILYEKLLLAVKSRMISDVPIGAFLSGGLDSSIIVGLMSRISSDPIKTFSIGYKNNTILDETKFSQKVAKFNNTDHTEIKLGYSDVISSIPKILDFMDEPFGDSSAIPTYFVSKETSQHVTVALSGDGADEVFGGYNKYLGEYYYRIYNKIPKVFVDKLIQAISILPSSRKNRISNFVRMIKKYNRGISDKHWQRHQKWMEIIDEGLLNSIFLVPNINNDSSIRKIFDELNNYDSTNKDLLTDIKTCLPNDMLVKVDWMSMFNSLEVRSPFLDYNILEFAMSLPGTYKINNRSLKFILKDTFSDILPKELKGRKKQGFEIPIGEWLKKELKELFFDSLNYNDEIIDAREVEKIYEKHCESRGDYSAFLWSVLVYSWWRKRNV